jgi:hypothetical protein
VCTCNPSQATSSAPADPFVGQHTIFTVFLRGKELDLKMALFSLSFFFLGELIEFITLLNV